jgi:hypothetical protein
VQLLSIAARRLKFWKNNGRIYQIHLNMNKQASNFDIMKSYYFARLLDNNLYKYELEENITTDTIELSIRTAEIEFSKVDFNELE